MNEMQPMYQSNGWSYVVHQQRVERDGLCYGCNYCCEEL